MHNTKWFVLTFVIYLVQTVQDKGKGPAPDCTQSRPSPTHGTPVDEVSYLCSNCLHIYHHIIIYMVKL